MTARDSRDNPIAQDYIGAIRLAMEATANLEGEHRVVEEILKQAPETPGDALWPTRILVDAIRTVGATVEVP